MEEAKNTPNSAVGHDWDRAAISYAGWVPTVSGHISFSLLGRASSGARVTHRTSDKLSRVVGVVQKRSADDFALPVGLMRFVRPGIVQRWILIARTEPASYPSVGISDEPCAALVDDQGMLCGKLVMLPHQETKYLRRGVFVSVQALEQYLHAAQDADKVAGEDIAGSIERRLETLPADCASQTVRFALFRTGEFRLWSEAGLSEWDQEEWDIFANQAYFFVKDTLHSHSHHHRSSDQLIPLTTLRSLAGRDDADRAEINWRREILWALSRDAEELSRTRSVTRLKQSLGIIAYAEAFQQNHTGCRRRAGTKNEFEQVTAIHHHDFAHSRESIKTRIDDIQTVRSGRGQLLTVGVATAWSAMTVINGSVSAKNSACAVRDAACKTHVLWPDNLIAQLSDHPMQSTVAAVMAACILLILFIKPHEPIFASRRMNWLPLLIQASALSCARAVATRFGPRATLAFALSITVHAVLIALLSGIALHPLSLIAAAKALLLRTG